MSRSKLYSVVVVIFTIALMSISSLGSPSSDVRQYGPFPSTTPDSGTCGNDWATDNFDRYFKVFTAPDAYGKYTVTESFKNGTFTTIGGNSPGACQNGTDTQVGVGLTGSMSGSFTIIISGGNYDPTAPANGTSTAAFVSSVFGPNATFEVPQFIFQYSAG